MHIVYVYFLYLSSWSTSTRFGTGSPFWPVCPNRTSLNDNLINKTHNIWSRLYINYMNESVKQWLTQLVLYFISCKLILNFNDLCITFFLLTRFTNTISWSLNSTLSQPLSVTTTTGSWTLCPRSPGCPSWTSSWQQQ